MKRNILIYVVFYHYKKLVLSEDSLYYYFQIITRLFSKIWNWRYLNEPKIIAKNDDTHQNNGLHKGNTQ